MKEQLDTLRRKAHKQRATLTFEYRYFADQAITDTLLSLPEFVSAKTVAAYITQDNEVETRGLLQAAFQQGKTIYLPRIQDFFKRTMCFHLYEEKDMLDENRYGILEPAIKKPIIPTSELDFVIVPLIGFDENCHRLGSGGGFYDRAFESVEHPFLCGVAYECQKVDALLPQPWDVKMNCVVTEEGIKKPG